MSDMIHLLRHEWDCMYYDQGMPTLVTESRKCNET